MKKLLPLFILIFACAASISAQTPDLQEKKTKTNLEAFQEKYGAVLVKGYSSVGRMMGIGSATVEIQARELKNASSNTKIKGLLIIVDTNEKYASAARSFIDYDEIDSLIKGIGYISKIDKSITSLANFEAAYDTKGDFSVTVFNDSQGKLNVAITAGSVGSKSVYTSMENLAELVSILLKAKAVLDELK
jgi:hypothetical protein